MVPLGTAGVVARRSRATSRLLTILSAGVAVGAICAAQTCVVAYQCDDGYVCTRKVGSFCAFSSTVRVAGDVLYATNRNATAAELASLLRGPCSPGDRYQTDQGGAMGCVPYFPFPSAENEEIMDLEAVAPHARACGRWIDAGGLTLSKPIVRSRVDHEAWREALRKTEDMATSSTRTATTATAKFRMECERTVAAGPSAVRAAATIAYRQMAAEVEKTTDRTGILRASGYIASHSCDASVAVETYLGADGLFRLAVEDGHLFGKGVLEEVLRLVGEPPAVQAEAEEASATIGRLFASRDTAPLDASDVREVVAAATGERHASHAEAFSSYTNVLASLLAYYRIAGLEKVLSYMRGIAAYCVYALRANVERLVGVAREEVRAIRSSRPSAASLGRLVVASGAELIVDNRTARSASSVTLSQLALEGWASEARTGCLHLMRVLFPDHLDEERFEATIPEDLYRRLEDLVAATRAGVASAMLEPPLRDALLDPEAVAEDVASASIRFAGAPRGSWAGIFRPLPEASMNGRSGVFSMALAQAREQFRDRTARLVFDRVDPCDHPPFAEATALNAYVVAPLKCVVVLLGTAKRPWLDANYDDKSLLARGVAVVGHELSHLTLNTGYASAAYEALLHRYRPSTRKEAIADVGAALGAIRTGMVDKDQFLASYCQLWCARTPLGWAANPDASHPEHNERCDFLHGTVSDHLVAVPRNDSSAPAI